MKAICLFLLLQILNAQFTCTEPIEIDPYTKDYDSGTFTLNVGNSKWNCNGTEITQGSYVFAFTPAHKAEFVISTCYPETLISPRIIVGTMCGNDVLQQCVNAEDATLEACEGHRSRIKFTATEKQKYYIMVTGTTAIENGQFRMVVSKTVDYNNVYCNNAVGIEVPSTQTFTTTADASFDSYQNTRGYWFTFTAEQEKIYINTCNKFTTVAAALYLFEADKMNYTDTRCRYDTAIISDKYGCGNSGRLAKTIVVGTKYMLYVTSSDDTETSPNVGSIQLYISYEADASTCEKAYAITSVPVTVTVSLKNMDKTTTSCKTENYGFYATIKGDGERYAIHTCATSGGMDSSVELFDGSCDACDTTDRKACGSGKYYIKTLEIGKVYYIRASSTTNINPITLTISKVGDTDNYQCSAAKEISVMNKGDKFSKQLIGATHLTSESGCMMASNKQGAWYKLTGIKDNVEVVVSVLPGNTQYYNTYIEINDDCSSPSLCSEFSNTAQFTLNKGKTINIFATAPLANQASVSEALPAFGEFMLFIGYGMEKNGKTIEDRIEVSLPYTGIALLGNSYHNWPCWQVRYTVGLYYGFKIEAGKSYAINTCGDETTNLVVPDVSGDYTAPDWKCLLESNFVPTCGNGGYVKVNVPSVLKDMNGLVSIHSSYEEHAKEVARVNIYEENAIQPNAECTSAEAVSVPSTKYFNTMYSYSSRRVCGETIDGIKGVWYTVTATKDKKLSINTDDITSFVSHIGVYKSCQTKLHESLPSECLAYGDHKDLPIGERGTSVEYDMKSGETIYVFVGAYKNTEDGLGRISFKWFGEEENDDDDVSSESKSVEPKDDGLSGGEIFGIVFGVIMIIVVIAAIVGVIMFFVIRSKKTQYGGF
ncbi:hypothetical protein EIN_251220 [Entamoeba invadens IP1]|uniref:Uncharacterized protein n=1 Tax=Entamoeba invadens IP1 TaxID=370355 RepID=A0A0A1UER8_ENTIV|nr:hypothetical protein EIN_251220 [Entamoeba invadens IP1]ELP94978.1 hypothetical protein EIN_251220 [Entamoeba invadens IP1]|eukprot:XP_004261749.1 hypothetical protein EIN_251220 [Entamoeba invadens IP1]